MPGHGSLRSEAGAQPVFAGSNPLRCLKQLDDYALKGKIGVIGNTSTDEGILKLMGEEVFAD
jgi:hypothetical protein